MSENHPGAWGAREEAMWWPSAVATDQQSMQQHFMHQHLAAQQNQQQQIDAAAIANSSASNTQQHFSYKMASSFQNPATTVSNATSSSPIGAAGIRGYDYSMTGGNPTMSAPAPASQWWYPPTTMDNLHNSLQNMQNNMAHMHQQQNNMSSVHTTSSQSDSQSRQEEAHRQEVNRQHQEAVQRQQEHHQALAEAHARQQLQQSQQYHLQNNHNNHQQHQQIAPQQPIHKGRMPRGKADARPRGRMTAYAFFVQTCREEHKKKHPEENVVFAEFSKKCAERWKTMLDKEKKRFHEMAENDKKRYDTEMLSYTPAKGEKQRGKKRKMAKDPNAPKRSLSAFFWFSNDERGKVKGQNPEYGVGDIAKELGRRWAEADAETKGKYEALADKDKARYEKEMTAYKKRNDPSLAKSVPEPEEVEEAEEDAEEEDDE